MELSTESPERTSAGFAWTTHELTCALAYRRAEYPEKTTLLQGSLKGTGNPPLPSRLNADFVVHGASELLLAAKVNFRCLDGYMTKEKLDLVKLASSKMAETCACAS